MSEKKIYKNKKLFYLKKNMFVYILYMYLYEWYAIKKSIRIKQHIILCEYLTINHGKWLFIQNNEQQYIKLTLMSTQYD